MLLPTEPVKMKSKEVTIPVKLKEGNPQNIKALLSLLWCDDF